jgi:hypothetical protein
MKRTFVHLTGMRGDGFGPALVGLALLSSCSGASLDTGNERAGSVGAASAEGGRLQPGVLVLGPADVAELSLQPDRLRFERLPAVLGNAKEGDVIASGVEGKSW